MHTATLTTMGLKTSPKPMSYAANWQHLMKMPGDSKYVVILLLAVALFALWALLGKPGARRS